MFRSTLICRAFRDTSRWLSSRRWRVEPQDVWAGSHVLTLLKMVQTAAPGQLIELSPGTYQLTGNSNSLDDVLELFSQPTPCETDTEAWEAWRVAINAWEPVWRPGKGGLLIREAGVVLLGLSAGVNLLYHGGSRQLQWLTALP